MINFKLNSFTSNYIFLTFSYLLTFSFGITVALFLPNQIGIVNYGYYKYFNLYSTFLGLFHLGLIDGLYQKYSGKFKGILVSEFYNTFLTLIIISIFFSLTLLLLNFLNLNSEFFYINILLILFMPVLNLNHFFLVFLQVKENFTLVSKKNIFLTLLNILGFIFFFFSEYTTHIYIYLLIIFLSHFILLLTYILDLKRFFNLNFKKHFFKLDLYLIKIGFPILVLNFLLGLVMNIDKVFVGLYFNLVDFSTYNFSFSFLSLTFGLMSSISLVLFPYINKLDNQDIERVYNKSSKYYIILILFLLIIIFPLSQLLQHFFPVFMPSNIILLTIFPTILVYSNIVLIKFPFIRRIGKHLLFLKITFFCLILFSILIIIFSPANTSTLSKFYIIFIMTWFLFVNLLILIKYNKKSLHEFIILVILFTIYYLTVYFFA